MKRSVGLFAARTGPINRPVLGIETSCDDTGVAVVRRDLRTGQGIVLAQKLQSQWDLAARFGGVYPDQGMFVFAFVFGLGNLKIVQQNGRMPW